MDITDRQKKIINILINSKDYITCQQIASDIGVSDRTVLNDVNKINTVLKSGKKLAVERGKGIKVTDKDTFFELHKLLDEESGDDIVLELIRKILVNSFFNQTIYLDDLSEELYISKTNLYSKIEEAKSLLREYQLELVISNKSGTYIKGKESNIRLCMTNLVFEKSEDYENLLENVNLFNRKEVEEIKKLILDILEKNGISLTYLAFNNFIVHVLISILRDGSNIYYSEELRNEITMTTEFYVINELVKDLNKKLGIKIKGNLHYLVEHLITSQRFTVDKKNFEGNQEINELVENIVKNIKKEFSIDLVDDNSFIDSLKMHLTTSLKRYHLNTPVKGIDLSEIKNQYPIAYDMGLVAANTINQRLKTYLDDTEILFLSLHLGTAFSRLKKTEYMYRSRILIVCGAGLSTARFLKYTLLENFQDEISIIDIIKYTDYNKDLAKEYDLVLSSINARDLSGKAIKVNYVLTELEIEILKSRIMLLKNKDIFNIFNNEIFYKEDLNSKEEILTFLTDSLIEKSYIDERIKKSIFEREKFGNTSIGNYVAIPHPLKYSAKKMSIGVLINSKPIIWDDKEAKLILLLLIPKDRIKKWDEIFKKLYRVFSKKDNVELLTDSKNCDEFRMILKNLVE